MCEIVFAFITWTIQFMDVRKWWLDIDNDTVESRKQNSISYLANI